MCRINPKIYLLCVICIIVVMRVLDAILTNNIMSLDSGSELNIFVSTDSVYDIFFSPIPFFLSLGVVVILLINFHDDRFLRESLIGNSKYYFILAFPYYYILGMCVILINNALVLYDVFYPVGSFVNLFKSISVDDEVMRWLGLCAFISIMYILFDPVVKRYLKYLYQLG